MKPGLWNLAVFSRRQGRSLLWRTLGLGCFDVELKVASPVSGPHELQRALAARLAEAGAVALAECRPAARLELRRVHLDLRFQQPDSYHLSGPALLVVERLAQPGGDAEIAYSPLRPADFFVVDPALDLGRQAGRFFAAALKGLAVDEARELLAQPHDRLQVVPTRIGWPALDQKKRGDAAERGGAASGEAGRGRRRRERVLDLLAIDVSGEIAAADPRLEALPARPSRLEERLLSWLAADHPPSFAFTGAAGCGKSALIRRLAARLLIRQGYLEHGRVEGAFQVFRLSGRRLISGMSYSGQWEQRCLDLLEECRERRRAGRRAGGRGRGSRSEPPPVVLWVDDLAAWGQIGQSRDSRRSLADLFLAPLRRRELLIFGETTPEGFALLEDDAPSFAAFFRRIEVARPRGGDLLSLLLEESRSLEDRGSAPFRPGALRALLETAPALYGEETHPGYSCRLLAQAAEESPAGGPRPAIEAEHLLELMGRESGLPPILLRPDEPLEMAELEAHFGQRVLGQEEAVRAVCELLVTLKAGLADPQRPYAVLLFTGPTGTGKTELAKALAGWLYGDERRLLRFDMGEHGDGDAVARLAGDRERPRGLLTEAVRAQPFSVLLFDEIDKADPGVLNLLLQVFEDGRLTDALGQVADFRQSVLIMTSNLGAHPNPKAGLKPDAEAMLIEARQAVERFFAPELWNRIDRVVAFRLLGPATGRRIAEIELYKIFARRGLVERGVFVRADPAVMDRIQLLAFDGRAGARGVKRFLEREVVVALARALAEADPAAYMLFQLSAPPGGDGFRVAVESIREAEPLPPGEAIERLYQLSPARLLAELPDWLARLEGLWRDHRPLLEDERSRRLEAWRLARVAESADEPGAAAPLAADAVHRIDLLRDRLSELSGRLEREIERRQPDPEPPGEAALRWRLARAGRAGPEKRRGRPYDPRLPGGSERLLAAEELVELAGEILWLEAATATPPERRQPGRVLVELDLLSEQRPAAWGRTAPWGRPAPSLQRDLAELLLEDGGLTLEGFVAEGPHGAGSGPAELAALLERRPSRLWLVFSGSLLAERLRGDVGCYVRVRADGNQEIVRLVAHLVGEAAGSPEELVARRAELAAADPPARPLRLLQVIHFEPPPPGGSAPCRVEDFGLCIEIGRPARRLSEALQPLRRRRQLALLEAEREAP